MLISSVSPTFSSTRSLRPFFDTKVKDSFGVLRLIVKPGHKQAKTLNNSLILGSSTSGDVKNSSDGIQVTFVPFLLIDVPVLLSSNTPSLNMTCSNLPSLTVSTTNQCER